MVIAVVVEAVGLVGYRRAYGAVGKVVGRLWAGVGKLWAACLPIVYP